MTVDDAPLLYTCLMQPAVQIETMCCIECVQLFTRMQQVEASSRAGETVFTALRPYDLHDSIVSVIFDLFIAHVSSESWAY